MRILLVLVVAAALAGCGRAGDRDAVTDLDLGRGPLVGTDVVVESARVQLRDGTDVLLDRGPSGWHIGAAGCRPANGPERPMDCELES